MISSVRGQEDGEGPDMMLRQSLSEMVISKQRPEGIEGENPGQHVNMCKGPEAKGGQCDR